MRYAIVFVALLAASPAFAQEPVVVTLTRPEAEALRKALDAVVKGGGLEAAKIFLPIDDKLVEAAKLAQDADLTEEAREKVKQADDAKKAEKDKPK